MKKNHVHLYKRVNLSTKKTPFLVYRCTKPNCGHYLRKELLDGKVAECPRCHEPFTLTKALIHNKAMPHCGCTSRSKKLPIKTLADDMLAQLFNKE